MGSEFWYSEEYELTPTKVQETIPVPDHHYIHLVKIVDGAVPIGANSRVIFIIDAISTNARFSVPYGAITGEHFYGFRMNTCSKQGIDWVRRSTPIYIPSGGVRAVLIQFTQVAGSSVTVQFKTSSYPPGAFNADMGIQQHIGV